MALVSFAAVLLWSSQYGEGSALEHFKKLDRRARGGLAAVMIRVEIALPIPSDLANGGRGSRSYQRVHVEYFGRILRKYAGQKEGQFFSKTQLKIVSQF